MALRGRSIPVLCGVILMLARQTMLAQAIANHDELGLIWLVLWDPEKRFYHNFNLLMTEIDAEDIELAYMKPLAILAIRLEEGKIKDEDGLFKLLFGIQLRVSWNLSGKAKRRPCPRITGRLPGTTSNSLRLFSQVGDAISEMADDSLTAIERLEEKEELLALYRELKAIPELWLSVLREFRRFELAEKTSYGAFQYVALLAELDTDENVISIRTPDPGEIIQGKPSRRVVRQIQKLYKEALDYLG
jgi:hypothetical protein